MTDLVGCIVCGVAINDFRYNYEYDPIISQQKKWARYKREPGFLFLEAEELEGHYVQRQSVYWQGLYRLIFYDHEKNKHFLSGVGQIIHPDNHDGGYVAPRDPEKAVIGAPVKDDVRLTEVYTQRFMGWWTCYSWGWFNWRNLPLGVHMSCWKIAQLILGPSIECNLELFTAIALQNARELIKQNHYLPVCSLDSKEPVTISSGPWFSIDDPLKAFIRINDPYRTHSIKETIARSKITKRPRFTYLKHRPRGLLDLPPELLYYQVLNLLTCKDISKLEIAMRIAIPDSYWRERAIEHLVETDGIMRSERNINWRFLSTKIEEASQINGRRHTVDILRGIKPRYLQNLIERVVPRLADLMYQIQDEVNGHFRRKESLENMLQHEPSIAGWIEYRQRNGMKPR